MSNEEAKQILIREMAETTQPLEAFEIAIKALERDDKVKENKNMNEIFEVGDEVIFQGHKGNVEDRTYIITRIEEVNGKYWFSLIDKDGGTYEDYDHMFKKTGRKFDLYWKERGTSDDN